MKKIFSMVILSLSILFFLSSCTKEESPVNVPTFSGKISLDRQRVGVDQPMTISVTIPPLSEDVSSVEYSFVSSNGMNQPVVPQHDICSMPIQFSKAGSYSVKFKARYLFVRADAAGSIFRDDFVELTVEVVACDVRNSFWGDSKAETQLNCDGKLTESPYGLEGTLPASFQSPMTQISKTAQVTYNFKDEKLNQVAETNTYKEAVRPFQHYGSLYLKHFESTYGKETKARGWVSETDFVTLPEELETLNDALDTVIGLKTGDTKAAMAVVEKFFVDGGAINCYFEKGDTKVIFAIDYDRAAGEVTITSLMDKK